MNADLFAPHFQDADKARAYLEALRWPHGPVESSFSLLKRGLVGTFHHVGEQHLQRYVTEFDFRWNHRKTTDRERSDKLLTEISGKRLTYAN